MTAFLFFIIGNFAGLLSGAFGIGGGIIMVPGANFLGGLSQLQAGGTSLFTLMMPAEILGTIKYYREGLIDLRATTILSIGLIPGAFLGAKIAVFLPINIMELIYGLFLVAMSWRFLKVSANNCRTLTPQKTILFLTGVIAGILSGLFGIGGGVIIVSVLHNFLSFDTKKAIATSLSTLLLPVRLPGVMVYYQNNAVNIGYALLMATGLMLGVFLGSLITLNVPQKAVKKAFGFLLLVIALKYFL